MPSPAGFSAPLDPAWYDAIWARASRRRFRRRPIDAPTVDLLRAFCSTFRPFPSVRAGLMEQAAGRVFTGVIGSYGKVEGAPLAAAFIARLGEPLLGTVERDLGYLGEAFVLEATRLGLGTCWIAGSFDKDMAGQLVGLDAGERVRAVTPLGYPADQSGFSERMLRGFVRADKRREIASVARGITDGGWPDWAVAAAKAVQAAPSGGNKQPWVLRWQDGALVLSVTGDKLYWTAQMDLGIAMLHAELGAVHEGAAVRWEILDGGPDVARLVPARRRRRVKPPA